MNDPAQRLWKACQPVPREYAVRDLRRIHNQMVSEGRSDRLSERGRTLMRKCAFAALIDAQEVARDGLTPVSEALL